jgi:hypothetical protein
MITAHSTLDFGRVAKKNVFFEENVKSRGVTPTFLPL